MKFFCIAMYSFREYRPKMNVSFVENGKVSALTPKTFVFVPELSAGDPKEDNVTTINIPAVVSHVKISSLLLIMRASFNRWLNLLQKQIDVAEYHGEKINIKIVPKIIITIYMRNNFSHLVHFEISSSNKSGCLT